MHGRFFRIQKHTKMSLILCLSFQLLFKHLIYYFLTLQSRSLRSAICSHCEWKMATAWPWSVYVLWLVASLYQFQSLRGEYWLAKYESNGSHCGCLNIARNASSHSTSQPSVACFWGGKTFPDKAHTQNAIDTHFSKQQPSKDKEDSVYSTDI